MNRLISNLLILVFISSGSVFAQTAPNQTVVNELISLMSNPVMINLSYNEASKSWVYVDPETKQPTFINQTNYKESSNVSKQIWDTVVSTQLRLKYLKEKFPTEYNKASDEFSKTHSGPNSLEIQQEQLNLQAYQSVDYCPFIDSFDEVKTPGREKFFNDAVGAIEDLKQSINACTGAGAVGAPSGNTQAPPSGGNTQAPPPGDNTQAPPSGGNTQAPPSGGNTQAPPSGGNTQAPPSGGNTQAPPPGGEPSGNQAPSGGETQEAPASTAGDQLEQLITVAQDIEQLSQVPPNETVDQEQQRLANLEFSMGTFQSVSQGLQSALEVIGGDCDSAAVKTFAVIESISSSLSQNPNPIVKGASGLVKGVASLGKALSLLAMKIKTKKLKNSYGMDEDSFKNILKRVQLYSACHNFYAYGELACGQDLNSNLLGESDSPSAAVYETISTFGDNKQEIDILMQNENWQEALQGLGDSFSQLLNQKLQESLLNPNQAQSSDSTSTAENTLATLTNKVHPLINDKLENDFIQFAKYATGNNFLDITQDEDTIKIEPKGCKKEKITMANGQKIKKKVCDKHAVDPNSEKGKDEAANYLAKVISTCNAGYPHLNAPKQTSKNRKNQNFNAQITHSDNYVKYCTVIDSCLTNMKAQIANSNSCDLEELMMASDAPIRGMYYNDETGELNQQAYCNVTKMSNENFKSGRFKKLAIKLMNQMKVNEKGEISCPFPDKSKVNIANSISDAITSYSTRCSSKNQNNSGSPTAIEK